MKRHIKPVLTLSFLAVLGGLGFIYSGIYQIGADDPHYRITYWALETLRERAIDTRLDDIKVPPLDNSEMLLSGGADYNDMCAGCHLKPGKHQSDLTMGLYPQPPNLAMEDHEPVHEKGDPQHEAARHFWIIKHGIKASGMPAWGQTHDDQRIWAMVAFIQRLPTLTPEQYQILTAHEQTP